MKATKTLNWMLMAALTVGLGMNFVACSSDDDDDKKDNNEDYTDPNDPYGKNSAAGIACYNLLSQLAGVSDDLPDNWKNGATFDPIEGMVLDESKPFVRTVVVDDLADAADYYSNLTNKTISSSTTSDTWTMEDVGTLTYTATNQSYCYATIDVKVKQLPKLTQLKLIPQSALPMNGAFEGTPYYRYGDVVRDEDGCHWICVLPCYQPSGKETSYWMSFQHNNSSIISLAIPGLKEQFVPNKLGSQKNCMMYLAQLLAVLSRPSEFEQKVGSQNFNGNDGFAKLPSDAMPNADILKAAQYWDQDGIWDKVKPSGMSTSDFKSYFNQQLTFIYNNYQQNKSKLVLTYSRYSDASNFYRGTPQTGEADVDMTSAVFNARNYALNGTGDNSTIGNKALVVRYKNGKTLSGMMALGNPDPTQPLDKVKTVYRFLGK
jgi:hypothetical protein